MNSRKNEIKRALIDGGFCMTAEEAEEMISEKMHGVYSDASRWAREYLEESGIVDSFPSGFAIYFDYAAYGVDCELNGDIFTIPVGRAGAVAVFSSY